MSDQIGPCEWPVTEAVGYDSTEVRARPCGGTPAERVPDANGVPMELCATHEAEELDLQVRGHGTGSVIHARDVDWTILNNRIND